MDERTDDWVESWQHFPLLAFVEQVTGSYDEAGVKSSLRIVLDVVRAGDVRSLPRDIGAARAELKHLPTAQVTLELKPPLAAARRQFVEGTWHQVRLGHGGTPATLYRDLDATESQPTSLVHGGAVTARGTGALAALTGLSDAPEATVTDLLRCLGSLGGDFLAVLNVGQGNCNALCDAAGLPLLYFDLGAGCLWNARTAPVSLNFCFTREPAILLSHWDFDHWYGAVLSRCDSLVRPQWLAPNQSIGVRTRKFASSLIGDGRLLIWPGNYRVFRTAGLAILQCSGSTKNDSGLALSVAVAGGSVLCPADASFDMLTELATDGSLAGLVASHHGSAHAGRPPRAVPSATLAFSFGRNNTYGHPTGSRAIYSERGWSRQLDTPAGGVALGGSPRLPPCGGRMCTGTSQG